MWRALSLLGAVFIALGAGCVGDRGPAGLAGDAGPNGPPGGGGAGGCGSSGSLTASLSISSPMNGSFFVAGDRPVVTIAFAGCLRAARPSRQPRLHGRLLRRGAAVTPADGHRIQAPEPHSGAVHRPGPQAARGRWCSRTEHDRPAGRDHRLHAQPDHDRGARDVHRLGLGDRSRPAQPDVRAAGLPDRDVDGRAVRERTDGRLDAAPAATATTRATGKTYMAHIAPGFSPVGNYALDSLPIGSCKACHNNAGYSPNHLLRKTHGVHRGEHQLAPGAAHPEYGFGPDELAHRVPQRRLPGDAHRRNARGRAARVGGDGEGAAPPATSNDAWKNQPVAGGVRHLP